MPGLLALDARTLMDSSNAARQFRDRVIQQSRQLRMGDYLCMQQLHAQDEAAAAGARFQQACRELHGMAPIQPA